VHRACESDEATALLKHYQYSIIITGTDWEDFGGAGNKLTQCIKSLEYRPRVVLLEETHLAPSVIPPLDDDATLVIEKPVSLLRLGDLMQRITSA